MPILINDTAPRAQYTATSGQTVFSVPFEFFANSNLLVYKNSTLLTITTHYTVTGAGVTGGGSITLVTGATAGDVITIIRDIPVERVTDFPTSGPFNIDALNTDLDRLTAMIREREDGITRVIQLAPTDTAVSLQLPAASARANKVLSFDTTGNAFVMTEIGNWKGNWATATAFALRDLVKDTSNNNVYICITAHTSTGSQPISSNADAAKWALLVDAASATASSVLAQEWAVKTTGQVASTDFSAKEYAQGTQASTGGSSKNWAQQTGADVTGASANSRSSKSWAQDNLAGATYGGSAKDWAQSSSLPDGTLKSAKSYATDAATSASNASTSASNASTSASNASSSATAAQSAQTAAEAARDQTLASFDSFDDRYLGTKASDPAVDNDGNSLIAGALYFNSTDGIMKVYNGTAWVAAYVSGAGFVAKVGGATGAADIPVGTTGERPAASTGYFRFNTTLTKFEGYNGTAWGAVGGGATGGGSDDIFVENGQTVTTNYTLTAGKNAMSAGPISINSGITVTVPSGAVWTIV